ncbi:HAD hydrolase family protein [Streptococcus suis]
MIRLIAFDMDGTFLNSQNDYDRPRFQKIFKKMQEMGDGWRPFLETNTNRFVHFLRKKQIK